MRNRFCSMLVLLTCLVMVLLALCIGGASAEGSDAAFLGKPFPDFTAADTEGNTFTLSEALKNHEAVLINFWATWCGPCLWEFPFLTETYEKYGDRVAFIALSVENNDTARKIAAYKKENGISFPMGRDEGGELFSYIQSDGIPTTVVVDRFGNAVYYHIGAFSTADALGQVLDAFLGDGYSETDGLNGAPQAYIIHVVDQNGSPVEAVTVNFCTDTACVPNESDENGTVTFTGAPDVYHVQIVDAPDGYSWDEDYEMYTAREYGEWVLRVLKD